MREDEEIKKNQIIKMNLIDERNQTLEITISGQKERSPNISIRAQIKTKKANWTRTGMS